MQSRKYVIFDVSILSGSSAVTIEKNSTYGRSPVGLPDRCCIFVEQIHTLNLNPSSKLSINLQCGSHSCGVTIPSIPARLKKCNASQLNSFTSDPLLHPRLFPPTGM